MIEHGDGRWRSVVTPLRPASGRARVLVADPDGLARRMVAAALRERPSLAVIGCASDEHETVELVAHYRPDLLLLDTRVAPASCACLVRALAQASPSTRIVTMSTGGDDDEALAALRAGAVGYLGKDLDPAELARLAARAAAGEAIVPRGLVMGVLELLREVPDAGWRPLHSRLTTREWEIVELLTDGASTEQIAGRLVLSEDTVYSHVKSLLRKLGVTCRRDAIGAAARLRHEEVLGRKLTTDAA